MLSLGHSRYSRHVSAHSLHQQRHSLQPATTPQRHTPTPSPLAPTACDALCIGGVPRAAGGSPREWGAVITCGVRASVKCTVFVWAAEGRSVRNVQRDAPSTDCMEMKVGMHRLFCATSVEARHGQAAVGRRAASTRAARRHKQNVTCN